MEAAKFGELKKLLSEFFTEESKEPEHKKADSRINQDVPETFFVVKDDRKVSGEYKTQREAVAKAKTIKGSWVEDDEGQVAWEPRGDSDRLDAAIKKLDSVAKKDEWSEEAREAAAKARRGEGGSSAKEHATKVIQSKTGHQLEAALKSSSLDPKVRKMIEGELNDRGNRGWPMNKANDSAKPDSTRRAALDKVLGRTSRKDADRPSTQRMFPSYTTAQLKEFLKTHEMDDEKRKKMETEVANRESGASVVRKTPQIEGGKVITKVGRL
jgi:hypothetical protein